MDHTALDVGERIHGFLGTVMNLVTAMDIIVQGPSQQLHMKRQQQLQLSVSAFR